MVVLENRTNLGKELSRVQKILSRVPEINRGGCGVATLAMYRWLKENGLLKEDTRVVFLYNNEDKYEHNQRVIQEGECLQRLTVPSHCAICYDGNTIDSKRKISKWEYSYKHTFTDIKYLEGIINSVGEWCSDFDRKFVPEIARTIGIDLSDIKTD
jgi:hypothetical protein